jgi:tRNA(fMet)-specific endonuclease VapC
MLSVPAHRSAVFRHAGVNPANFCERQAFNERKLQQIINRLKIEIVGVDPDVARKYGLIYLSLERKGARIPIHGVWIAACCMEVGGTLLTRDRHFAQVDQIETLLL